MTTKPDLSPESIRELLQASSVRRRFGEATPLVRALLEEIVRLRALKLRPVGPTVPTIGTLVSHRNRSLPQDPPEEK